MKSLIFWYPCIALVEAMNFHFWLNEFRSTELHRSKREVFGFSFSLLSLYGFSFQAENVFFSAQKSDFNLIHNLNAWPTLCHVSTTGPSLFLPLNDLFPSGLSSIYFKMKLFLFFAYGIFHKNPVFGVH